MKSTASANATGYGFLGPALFFIFGLIVVPILCLGVYSFWSLDDTGLMDRTTTLATWGQLLVDTYYASMFLKTLVFALGVTVISAVIGYGPAYFLVGTNPKLRGVLILLLFLPSWISYVVRTMSWIPILGKFGLVNNLLVDIGIVDAPLPLLYNGFSVYVGMVHFLLPIMILNIFIGLQTVDRNVVSAARTLGAGSAYAFVTVVFPLALPGLAAGCLLCFILSTGAYITPMILGGPGSKYFSNVVYDTIITQLDWPTGAALSLLLIAMLTLLVYIYGRVIGLSTITRAMKA